MLINRKFNTVLLNSLSILLLTIGFAACSDSKSDGELIPNEAYWKVSSTVAAAQGSSAIMITGTPGAEWTAEITQGASWCSFSYGNYDGSATKKSGAIENGDAINILYVYYPANTTKAQRQANITFTFAGEEPKSFSLIQLAQDQENQPFFNRWAELPADKVNSNYQYVTHYALLDNQTVRNYSICFDKSKKAALWVAYPLHNCYLGGQKRTDAWAYDPVIPQQYQPNLNKSYKSPYDRGHQLPSADRLANYELNAQTFYFSNMTPQLNRLNQDMWANLETQVRNNRCTDTLYVVTGAYFGANATTTTDGAGNVVPLPTNYFKVLLRTKSGTTGKAIQNCSASELISIGFWVEQKSYGNIQPPTSICTSVEEIEKKTGFKFFPMVESAVKQQNNPAIWGIN